MSHPLVTVLQDEPRLPGGNGSSSPTALAPPRGGCLVGILQLPRVCLHTAQVPQVPWALLRVLSVWWLLGGRSRSLHARCGRGSAMCCSSHERGAAVCSRWEQRVGPCATAHQRVWQRRHAQGPTHWGLAMRGSDASAFLPAGLTDFIGQQSSQKPLQLCWFTVITLLQLYHFIFTSP